MDSEEKFESLSHKKYILIKGARVNNLKNIDVFIPRNKLVVITGVSGSGKSSLAFDTLFAEGQRKYVESLNSYIRQFLGKLEKPDVDYIKGISPAIAIEQKVGSVNPNSTVGTITEIYEYMKMLFTRIGETISPISGEKVTRDSVTSVVDWICSFPDGEKVIITYFLKIKEGRTLADELRILLGKGFTRVVINGEFVSIEELLEENVHLTESAIEVLVDRVSVSREEGWVFRVSDSIQTAFYEGEGRCSVDILGIIKKEFSDVFERDGMVFEEPSLNFFSFNNAYGICKKCDGKGSFIGIDENLVIPDKSLSVAGNAVDPWNKEKHKKWFSTFMKNALNVQFPLLSPYNTLTESEKKILWQGDSKFEIEGIDSFFKGLEQDAYYNSYDRTFFMKYKNKIVCPDCNGSRLRKDAGYVKINGTSLIDLCMISIDSLSAFFDNLVLREYDKKVSYRILIEIQQRLQYLRYVGLGYLTIQRSANTLSGGELQRIKLSTALGSALVGSLYVLDEPSIGLHPKDTVNLVQVLKKLRDIGNTVVVVEHEEEVMRASDSIIDIGPDAGVLGGNLVFQGVWDDLLQEKKSHTGRFLSGKDCIEVPKRRRKWDSSVDIYDARENNLKNIHVKIPLHIMTVITGVSGSGKSTLVKQILKPALEKNAGRNPDIIGKYDRIVVNPHRILQVEMVDQNSIGVSSRSNPVSYMEAYDAIRVIFSDQPLSKQQNFYPGMFSFNVLGGRCETCMGEGFIKIEMQFMADVKITCEECNGKRFKEAILGVTYKEKNIYEVLNMTVDEAIEYFSDKKNILGKLKPLQDVGLGYLRLGQPSSTLSGGEAQRLKLAYFITEKKNYENTFFIFDEPTTGLHFHDIKKLMKALNILVDMGSTVLIIEHNVEVIKCADWIIDLGPEAGEKGGHICFQGTPENMILLENNHTAHFLKQKLIEKK